MSERFPGEVECVRCDLPLSTCSCPKGWMENRALWVAADRRAIAAEDALRRICAADGISGDLSPAVDADVVIASLADGQKARTEAARLREEVARLTKVNAQEREVADRALAHADSLMAERDALAVRAAAPRTVTREQVEKWALRFATIEERPDMDYEWSGHIVAMLADLGLQVEGDQGKETPSE